jgi:hypothetical protein
MTASPLPKETDQVVTLARTFLARFFDNDVTGGSEDVRHSFLWLLGAMALPGFWAATARLGAWTRIALFRGPDALRMESAPDKIFILGTSMVMVAMLTAIVWQSLLIDRRDVLVIGSYPVRHRTVLAGKFGALVAFFGIITVAMQTIASFFYGMFLGMHGGPLFGLWQMLVHFVVSGAAGLFMYLSVIAAQGLLLGLAGPRQFGRLAPVLQLVLITGALLLFAMLPLTAGSAAGPIYGLPAREMANVLWMPPVWFLGLYETLLGTSNPVLHQLAGRALAALAAVAAIALLSYPLAYRRVVNAALVGAAVAATRGPVRRLIALVPSLLARHHVARAGLQFVMATIGRTTLHRLVIAMALGIGTAFIVPVVSVNLGAPASYPTPGLLSVSTLLMLFLLVALRVAVALPAELSGTWLFAISGDESSRWYRIAVRRFFWAAGVVPPTMTSLVAFWIVWGPAVAWQHALLSVGVGIVLVEILVAGLSGVPCGRAYAPGGARLRSRWPWYLLLLVTLNIYIPQAEARLLRGPSGVPILAAVLVALALAVRLRADWRQRQGVDGMDPEAMTVIDLQGTGVGTRS